MIDISIRYTLIRIKYLETDGINGNLLTSPNDTCKGKSRRT